MAYHEVDILVVLEFFFCYFLFVFWLFFLFFCLEKFFVGFYFYFPVLKNKDFSGPSFDICFSL